MLARRKHHYTQLHDVELDICLFSKMLLAVSRHQSMARTAASEESNFIWLFFPSTAKDDKCIVSGTSHLQKGLSRLIPT